MSDILFFQRSFPSANMALLTGEQAILIDSGFGSDFEQTLALLKEHDHTPHDLQLVANTHFHCDHNGGNHHLQIHYNVPIAAYHSEGRMINQRDYEACSVHWLDQAIEPYTVDILLKDGDILDTGTRQWQVIHTPGHTLGHAAYYSDGVLIAGDTFHDDDIAWLNPFREGASAIYHMLDTLDKLAQLPLTVSYSGHGAPCHTPRARIDQARRRYERWLAQPEKIAWHAMKRIFTYALMLYEGMTRPQIDTYLLGRAWYQDYTQHVLRADPEAFIDPFMQELHRAQAITERDGVFYASADYVRLPTGWLQRVQRGHIWGQRV